MKVNIENIDLIQLLEALYDGALYGAKKFNSQPSLRKYATQGTLSSPLVKRMFATQFIKEKNQSPQPSQFQFGLIDLGEGPRDLAIDLSTVQVDVSHYNALHGENAANRIIARLKGIEQAETKSDQTKESLDDQFCQVLLKNILWLEPMLAEMKYVSNSDQDKSQKFIDNLSKILTDSKIQAKFETKPNQSLYLTWIYVLDPSIDISAKEKACLKLHQSYLEDQKSEFHQLSLGGTLSELPIILMAPILAYSPKNILTSYIKYQKKYRSVNVNSDESMVNILKFLIRNPIFSKQVIITFINNLVSALQPNEAKENNDNIQIFETMAKWERESLMSSLLPYFNDHILTLYKKMNERIQEQIHLPDSFSRLSTEMDALIFENLVIKHNKDAKALTARVCKFNSDDELKKLINIYAKFNCDANDMLIKHILELAILTNKPDSYPFSSLFFCCALRTLGEKRLAIVSEIAAVISPTYFALNLHAFDNVSKQMYYYWISKNPKKMVAVIEAILNQPSSFHETPINKFFFHLSYDKMSEIFYKKLSILLASNFNFDQFIKLYTAADEDFQLKLLQSLIKDEQLALKKIQSLLRTYAKGNYSVSFPRLIADQLKTLNPSLCRQAEAEKILLSEPHTDLIEEDLGLLKKILENGSLTHNQRRSEIQKLNYLQDALKDEIKNACPTVIRMFDAIPQKFWPDLFNEFDTAINHWSFPWDEKYLITFSLTEKKPESRKITWINFALKWEQILSGTLKAILPKMKQSASHDAHWAISNLDVACSQTKKYFPGMADNILKTFFLENLPESIEIFEVLYNQFNDKYHQPIYSDQQGIYNSLSAWMPENVTERAFILAKLSMYGFEKALKFPFVRIEEDLVATALIIINQSTYHLVNLLQELSADAAYLIFKSLARAKLLDFITLLKNAYLDVVKLPMPDYLKNALMLLSYCSQVNIDIFQIIDSDPHKKYFLKTISDIKSWEETDIFYYPYRFIFNVINHYQPKALPEVVFQHVQALMNKDDIWRLCHCIDTALLVTSNKLMFNVFNKAKLVEFLCRKMESKLPHISTTELKVMSHYIPNFGNVFMTLFAKSVEDISELSYAHKECLQSLRDILGLNQLKYLCFAFHLKECQKYIAETFSYSSFILDQINEAKKIYAQIFDDLYYIFDEYTERRFYDELQSRALKTAKNCKEGSFQIDVSKVCTHVGIRSDIADKFPALTLKQVSLIEVETFRGREEKKPETISHLMVTSQRNSGLIKPVLPPLVSKSAKRSADCLEMSNCKILRRQT